MNMFTVAIANQVGRSKLRQEEKEDISSKESPKMKDKQTA